MLLHRCRATGRAFATGSTFQQCPPHFSSFSVLKEISRMIHPFTLLLGIAGTRTVYILVSLATPLDLQHQMYLSPARIQIQPASKINVKPEFTTSLCTVKPHFTNPKIKYGKARVSLVPSPYFSRVACCSYIIQVRLM